MSGLGARDDLVLLPEDTIGASLSSFLLLADVFASLALLDVVGLMLSGIDVVGGGGGRIEGLS